MKFSLRVANWCYSHERNTHGRIAFAFDEFTRLWASHRVKIDAFFLSTSRIRSFLYKRNGGMEGGVFFLAGTFSFREGETVSLRDTAINAMVQRVCKGLMIESAL